MHDKNQRPLHNYECLGTPPLASRPPELDRVKRDFTIHTPTPTSVSLILPPGCSRFEFLERAHDAVQWILGADLIDSDLLDEWHTNPLFNECYDYPVEIAVEIQRDGERPKKLAEHEVHLAAYGQKIATEEDTAVAFAAFFVSRGMDLFNGEGVQTDRRGLQLNDDELIEIEFYKTVAVAVDVRTEQPDRSFGL
jgi:hypothetical protein